jgi:hypothetical protein
MWPFKNWTAIDFLAIGLAALCLGIMSEYLLHNDLGRVILSWVGIPMVLVGVAMLFRDHY